jgi:hypothetical protein
MRLEMGTGRKNGIQIDAGSVGKAEELILVLYRLATTEGYSRIRSQRQPTTSSRGCTQQCHFQLMETIPKSSPLLRSSNRYWLLRN